MYGLLQLAGYLNLTSQAQPLLNAGVLAEHAGSLFTTFAPQSQRSAWLSLTQSQACAQVLSASSSLQLAALAGQAPSVSTAHWTNVTGTCIQSRVAFLRTVVQADALSASASASAVFRAYSPSQIVNASVFVAITIPLLFAALVGMMFNYRQWKRLATSVTHRFRLKDICLCTGATQGFKSSQDVYGGDEDSSWRYSPTNTTVLLVLAQLLVVGALGVLVLQQASERSAQLAAYKVQLASACELEDLLAALQEERDLAILCSMPASLSASSASASAPSIAASPCAAFSAAAAATAAAYQNVADLILSSGLVAASISGSGAFDVLMVRVRQLQAQRTVMTAQLRGTNNSDPLAAARLRALVGVYTSVSEGVVDMMRVCLEAYLTSFANPSNIALSAYTLALAMDQRALQFLWTGRSLRTGGLAAGSPSSYLALLAARTATAFFRGWSERMAAAATGDGAANNSTLVDAGLQAAAVNAVQDLAGWCLAANASVSPDCERRWIDLTVKTAHTADLRRIEAHCVRQTADSAERREENTREVRITSGC